MPAVLEGAVPPPHLHLTSKSSWPSYSTPLKYLTAPTSSPLPMSPESLHNYLPHLHDSQVPTQDLSGVPTSGWFGATVPAPEQNETGYAPFGYDQPYVTPHTSSITFSPPTQFPKSTEAPVSVPREASIAAYSPVSVQSRVSDPGQHDFSRPADESYSEAPRHSAEPAAHAAHLQIDSNPPNRPRSSPSTFSPNQTSSGPVEYPWTMNPLGISTPNMHEQFYSSSTFPSPRRMYAPIAPHPMAQGRTSMPAKRSREDDEFSEQAKRRKRSETNASSTTIELGEEDKLLIQLKDEDGMPWKDIAARFQSDLGKTYQIPALQMRLKRLRERMRVWTETDVRALRMAHEYWVQSKFDIISQKMLEFGAAEKWTARQCARKWTEIDPGPTPYTSFDHHSTQSYAPYTMSPVEAAPPFMPYLHIP